MHNTGTEGGGQYKGEPVVDEDGSWGECIVLEVRMVMVQVGLMWHLSTADDQGQRWGGFGHDFIMLYCAV